MAHNDSPHNLQNLQNPHNLHDNQHHHDYHRAPDFRFCPKCGGVLNRQLLKANEPKRLVCENCSFIFYDDPKVAACAIPIVDGKILLLKRGIEPGYGKWVFPGGFMDRGERVEDAAIRETWEEAGLKIALTRLLNVYSYTGQRVVIIVYLATVLNGTPQALDETLEARLFTRTEIPWQELAFPSTRDALSEYISLAAPSPE